MSNDDDRWRTAAHEGGHAVAADALGFTPGAATCEPTQAWSGRTFYRQPLIEADAVAVIDAADPGVFVSWPAAIRARIEREVCVTMAGDEAEQLFAAPLLGRVREWGGTDRGDAALPPPSEGEFAAIAEHAEALASTAEVLVDDLPHFYDESIVSRLAGIAHGPTDIASRVSWLEFLRMQTRALLLRYEQRVRFVALALAQEGTVGAEQWLSCSRSGRESAVSQPGRQGQYSGGDPRVRAPIAQGRAHTTWRAAGVRGRPACLRA